MKRGRAVVLAMLIACSPAPAITTTLPTSTTLPPTTEPPTTIDPRTEAQRVYDLLSPYVALVETEIASGSAMVVGPERMVTNFHVAWPYQVLSVTFADGTSFEAEVLSVDSVMDIAVLSVPGLELEAPPLGDPSQIRNGSNGYLVGYPLAPGPGEPTITLGLLSSPRVAEELEVTFLITDATIESGQSGGILASSNGEVLGMTGFSVGSLAVALALEDVLERVEAAGDEYDLGGAGDRRFPERGEGATEQQGAIRSTPDEWVYLAAVEGVDSFTLEATEGMDVRVMAAGGVLGLPPGPDRIPHSLEAPVDAPGPYLVVVSGPSDNEFNLTSSVPLLHLPDPDDGLTLAPGDRIVAAADFVGDLDWFLLDLAEDQEIRVRAEGGSVGVVLIIDETDGEISPLAVAQPKPAVPVVTEVEYTADETATYLLVVDTLFHPGGYVLTVE